MNELNRRRFLTAALAAGLLPRIARAEPEPDALARVRGMSPEERARLKEKLEAFRRMPPEEQRQLIEAAKRFSQLSREDKENLRAAHQRFRALSPRQRAMVRENHRRFKQMTPAERDQIRARVKRLRHLSPEQRKALRKKIRAWRKLSPAERETPAALPRATRYPMMSRAPLVLPFSIAILACSGTGTDDIDDELVATTSYLRDIQPLVERSCMGCHVAGGVAPFSFEDPSEMPTFGPAMLNAIQAGRMPPFYADRNCNDYSADPRLSADEQSLFEKWVQEGAPLGEASEAKHASIITPAPVRPDIAMDLGDDFDAVLMAGSDNYRCFVMDPEAITDLRVVGAEVVPGNRAIVHHVLAYVVPPNQVSDLQANDDADPGLGYECMSGGVGVRGAVANQIAGWVPGSGPIRFPAGSALTIEAGSRIVIQIHYNLLSVPANGSTIDRTRLVLETSTDPNLRAARILPAVKPNLSIPAGETRVVQIQEVALPRASVGTEAYAFAGHMHMLGTQVKLEVLHSDGSSSCMLDIPRWDFQWQRTYELVRPYTVRTGDRLRLTCVYDNSAANQPMVNGQRQAPRDVSWGESSLDEMCMTYMTFVPPS